MTSDLYREEILEHYKEPSNFGRPKSYNASSRQLNPFCGDEIELFVKSSEDRIEDVGFIGNGCAISIASTSILTEFIRGKKVSELTNFTDEDMLSLLNLEISDTRKKCALLGLAVLKDCIN